MHSREREGLRRQAESFLEPVLKPGFTYFLLVIFILIPLGVFVIRWLLFTGDPLRLWQQASEASPASQVAFSIIAPLIIVPLCLFLVWYLWVFRPVRMRWFESWIWALTRRHLSRPPKDRSEGKQTQREQ